MTAKVINFANLLLTRIKNNLAFSPLTPHKCGANFAGGFAGITSLLFATSIVVIDGLKTSAQAQITPAANDANTIINQSGNTINITGGTQAGANLFHSFDKFGLDRGQIANFLSNPSIQNILGRVSGGDASVINGLIQVTGGNSNLYLINPAGIVFGSGASLNVPASFTATTANGIGLGDKWLNALGTNDYASLVGSPNSFAFTQSGVIFNAGDLAVEAGQNLTLLGGTVISTGRLSAPSGNITIRAVPGEKLVRITSTGSLLSLELPVETKAAINQQPFTPLSLPQLLTGGNISDATGVTVDRGVVKLTGSGITIPNTPGTAFVSNVVDVSGKTGGNVNIQGNNVSLINANINASGQVSGGKVVIGGNNGGQETVLNTSQIFVTQDSTINGHALENGPYFIDSGDNITFGAAVVEPLPCGGECSLDAVPSAVVNLPLPLSPLPPPLIPTVPTAVVNLPLPPTLPVIPPVKQLPQLPSSVVNRPLAPVTQIFPTQSPNSGIVGKNIPLYRIEQQTAQLQLNTQTNTFACNLPNNVAITMLTDSRIAVRSKAVATNSINVATNACNTADDEKQILQLLGETPNLSQSK
jgi:filamentous hemagglutinin family protein